MSQPSCQRCGKPLTLFNHLPQTSLCHDCARAEADEEAALAEADREANGVPSPEGTAGSEAALRPGRTFASALEEGREKAFAKLFRESGPVTQDDILQRPVSVTIPRLVVSAIVIALTTFFGSLVGVGKGWVSSLVGCMVGVLVMNKFIFLWAHPLDRRRMLHFWRGDVLGYWLAYIPLQVLLASRLTGDPQRDAWPVLFLGLGGYFMATAFGMAVGLGNLYRTDRKEKERTVYYLQLWQAREAADAAADAWRAPGEERAP